MADEASISNIEPFKSLNEATYSSFHRTLIIITSLGAFTDLYTTLSLGASTFSIIPFFFMVIYLNLLLRDLFSL
ncbi:hypothetical protein [Saccharolobus islandicus]|uniref:hypothetical protein n=1 Tax=Saccharolobus islandicus TaxID=43080 RepID=UPI001F495957|nr:hypothetical protein [Sulfolobus islandicus]